MRESSEEDFGVRDVAGFVMEEEVKREDVQGMELKKIREEVREGGGVIVLRRAVGGGVGWV
jgi:hypothetical protein